MNWNGEQTGRLTAMTVGVFMRAWLDDVHKHTIRESTYLLYKGIVTNHLPEIGRFHRGRDIERPLFDYVYPGGRGLSDAFEPRYTRGA